MTKIVAADNANLMSPRTVKYVEAMIREGDNFNYYEWLKRVREEEAQTKQTEAARTRRDVVADEVGNAVNTCVGRNANQPSLAPPPIGKPGLNLRSIRWRHRQPKSQPPKARLRRWLEKPSRLARLSRKSCSRCHL
jgi:hypothetical protein